MCTQYREQRSRLRADVCGCVRGTGGRATLTSQSRVCGCVRGDWRTCVRSTASNAHVSEQMSAAVFAGLADMCTQYPRATAHVSEQMSAAVFAELVDMCSRNWWTCVRGTGGHVYAVPRATLTSQSRGLRLCFGRRVEQSRPSSAAWGRNVIDTRRPPARDAPDGAGLSCGRGCASALAGGAMRAVTPGASPTRSRFGLAPSGGWRREPTRLAPLSVGRRRMGRRKTAQSPARRRSTAASSVSVDRQNAKRR